VDVAKAPKHPKAIIGWREWCALPDLALPGVLAKIDTGAKTSSLHAFDIRPSDRGDDWLQFSVHPVQRRRKPDPLRGALRRRARRDQLQRQERERPVIETTLVIGSAPSSRKSPSPTAMKWAFAC
jgi:hypothetical protein